MLGLVHSGPNLVVAFGTLIMATGPALCSPLNGVGLVTSNPQAARRRVVKPEANIEGVGRDRTAADRSRRSGPAEWCGCSPGITPAFGCRSLWYQANPKLFSWYHRPVGVERLLRCTVNMSNEGAAGCCRPRWSRCPPVGHVSR